MLIDSRSSYSLTVTKSIFSVANDVHSLQQCGTRDIPLKMPPENNGSVFNLISQIFLKEVPNRKI